MNIPDTVGYTVPDEFGELFRYLRENVPGIERVVLSVHCHDDLGMAVANSLTAVLAGARQVECTINGIGERAGNCSLEEVVMALKTREAYFRLRTGIDTTRLYPTSRLVSSITGMPIPRNKAVIGENAFAHESGIHQHGMLRHHSTYEIMRPQDVGLSRTHLVLGKHSGRHAFRERVRSSASSSTRPSSIGYSRSSRRWPTRRRSCSTATSRRWCCAPGVAQAARGRSLRWTRMHGATSAPRP